MPGLGPLSIPQSFKSWLVGLMITWLLRSPPGVITSPDRSQRHAVATLTFLDLFSAFLFYNIKARFHPMRAVGVGYAILGAHDGC